MEKILSELISIRRRLHRFPELSFQEHETTKFIAKTVKAWGLQFHRFENIDTGGYCDIGKGEIYSFRSDIDALPINENPDHEIRSKNSGIMHACGHDFHTAIGLGLLKYFSVYEDELNGKVRVIFQPGEEASPGGAEKVVQENIWNNVKGIITVHVDPSVGAGKFVLIKGAVQASSTSVIIEISGPGGHTSKPFETIDLISTASFYIVQLQVFLKQKIDPREMITFTFGSIEGGSAHNIIPHNIRISGTIRTFNNDVLNHIINLIQHFSSSFEKLYGTGVNIQFPASCPASINDSALSKKFVNFMKERADETDLIMPLKPSIGADDFAFYLNKVPGLYLQIGGAGKGTLHSGDLQLNEDLIKPAVKYLAEFISSLFRSQK